MTTENNKKNYSRDKARKMVKQLIPNLPRNIIVHHLDLNPLNNSRDNLSLMLSGNHIRLHALISGHWGREIDTIRLLDRLESWLVIYNNY